MIKGNILGMLLKMQHTNTKDFYWQKSYLNNENTIKKISLPTDIISVFVSPYYSVGGV